MDVWGGAFGNPSAHGQSFGEQVLAALVEEVGASQRVSRRTRRKVPRYFKAPTDDPIVYCQASQAIEEIAEYPVLLSKPRPILQAILRAEEEEEMAHVLLLALH